MYVLELSTGRVYCQDDNLIIEADEFVHLAFRVEFKALSSLDSRTEDSERKRGVIAPGNSAKIRIPKGRGVKVFVHTAAIDLQDLIMSEPRVVVFGPK